MQNAPIFLFIPVQRVHNGVNFYPDKRLRRARVVFIVAETDSQQASLRAGLLSGPIRSTCPGNSAVTYA